jgi:hypothetical protein
MSQSYTTSEHIAGTYRIGQSIQIFFSHTSVAYQKYGAYVVGWLIQQEADRLTEPDFPLDFEILSQANALLEVGSEYEAEIPSLKKISFRGSEVTRIEKYG